MSERITITPPSSSDGGSLSTNVSTHIDRKFKDLLILVVSIFLSMVFGGIISAMWDMNSKISQVVGQEAVRTEVTNIRKERIVLLEKQLEKEKTKNEELQLYKVSSEAKLDALENSLERSNKELGLYKRTTGIGFSK
ncbi:hypothetical protein [Shewanella pneumatophori]|uniref:Uncharacterized protein n=1 Tax=Shewanella pneumatophori TaxID=314092 RepID=A0A9X2CFT4_9GAMM|nr:hypothetical protein [Shewanella pneumatophori]MCL1138241.1 hypothetical protein [Shewanella pneumatophori]